MYVFKDFFKKNFLKYLLFNLYKNKNLIDLINFFFIFLDLPFFVIKFKKLFK